jgi:modification target Cys-rich repeat protein
MTIRSGFDLEGRAKAQEIVERIVRDPSFREQLRDSPVETLATAGYASARAPQTRVVRRPCVPGTTCRRATCKNTCKITCAGTCSKNTCQRTRQPRG